MEWDRAIVNQVLGLGDTAVSVSLNYSLSTEVKLWSTVLLIWSELYMLYRPLFTQVTRGSHLHQEFLKIIQQKL